MGKRKDREKRLRAEAIRTALAKRVAEGKLQTTFDPETRTIRFWSRPPSKGEGKASN
jgi:hypothetical protein